MLWFENNGARTDIKWWNGARIDMNRFFGGHMAPELTWRAFLEVKYVSGKFWENRAPAPQKKLKKSNPQNSNLQKQAQKTSKFQLKQAQKQATSKSSQKLATPQKITPNSRENRKFGNNTVLRSLAYNVARVWANVSQQWVVTSWCNNCCRPTVLSAMLANNFSTNRLISSSVDYILLSANVALKKRTWIGGRNVGW